MVAFIYPNGEKDGYGEAVVSFDTDSSFLFVSILSDVLPFENSSLITAFVQDGKISEFLDLLEGIAKESQSDTPLNKLLKKYSNSLLSDYVVISLCSSFIKKNSMNLREYPDKLYKLSPDLFFSLFNLAPLGRKLDESKNIESFGYDFFSFLEERNVSYVDSLMMFYYSLKTLPSKITPLIKNHTDILCMAEVWLENLHKKENVDKKKLKDKTSLYLFSRLGLDMKDGRISYDDSRRKISKAEYLTFLEKTSLGRVLNLSKNGSLFEESLVDLERSKEIEIHGDYFYLTTLGIGISGYLIPRILRFKA